MRVRGIAGLAMLAAFVATSASARVSTAHRQIQQAYDGFAQLFDSKQFGTIDKMMPPNFTTVVGGKTYNHAQFVGGLRGMGQPLQHPMMSFRLTDFHQRGSRVSVLAHMTLLAGAPDAHGKVHRLVYHQTERANWVHTPQGWAPMHSVVVYTHKTVDGRAAH